MEAPAAEEQTGPIELNEPVEPAARRVGPWLVRLLLVVLVLAIGGGIVWVTLAAIGPLAFNRNGGPAGPPAFLIDREYPDARSAAPDAPGVPATATGSADTTTGPDPLDAWAARIAAATNIPARAAKAYAKADLAARTKTPSCHLSWATLAGLGWVESKHGQFHGAVLGADGRSTPPIIGPALDGTTEGLRKIPATDGGELTGDPQWEHAVGAMQFLPSTWKKWGVRANGDGAKPDPQNIDDAAMAAAGYVCSGGRDLATGPGWWAGVFAYNNSLDYGQRVFSAADAYARAGVGK